MTEINQDDIERIVEGIEEMCVLLRRIDKKLLALPHDTAYQMGYKPTPFPAINPAKPKTKTNSKD
jgi:hypothetical protein